MGTNLSLLLALFGDIHCVIVCRDINRRSQAGFHEIRISIGEIKSGNSGSTLRDISR